MAETPSVTPTSSSSTVKSGNPNISAPTHVKPVGLSNLSIEQAPQQLITPPQPITIEGTVIYSNQETGEIRISTEAGEVTVKSTENLPHGTKVLLKLHAIQEQTLVDIIVIEQGGEGAKDSAAINEIQNAETPTIKEGQKLPATLIEPPQQKELELLLNDLNSITKEDIIKLNLPLEKNIIDQIIANYDIKNVLKTLPEEKFNEILSILLSHINATKLKATHPNMQHKLQTAYSTTPPSTIEQKAVTPTQPDDQEILQALYKDTTATTTKTTEATPQQTNLTGTEQTLSPLTIQESVQTKTIETSTTKQPTQNKYNIDVIKIIPINTSDAQIKEAIDVVAKETSTAAAKYHTPEYDALPIKAAVVDEYKHKGLHVLKTINPEISLSAEETERFAINTPVDIDKKSIIIFKAIPINESTVPLAENTANIVAAIQSEVLDKTFITREKWPALDETIKVLNEIAPQTAQNVKNSLIPPSIKLVPTTLFFLAALRLGNVENWIGSNALKALRSSGRRELADKLTTDFTRMSNLSKEPIVDEWRPFSLPFMHDEQLNQVQMYIRDQYADENHGDEREKSTRFILNLNLSRMGQLQLDGNTSKKNLDLIVRSEENLPFPIRQEIMKHFAKGVEQVNMQGNISFQTKQQQWVEINIPDDDVLRV